jgi:hypothetical protein
MVRPLLLAALLACLSCCKSGNCIATPLPLSALQGDAGDNCHTTCALLRKNNCDGITPGCETNCENDQLQGTATQESPQTFAAILDAGTLRDLGSAAGTICIGVAPGVGVVR